MLATRLSDYFKAADGYCRSYILITKKHKVEDIINSGKELVLFGWSPKAAHVVSELRKAGLDVKTVCEVGQIPPPVYADGMPVGDGLLLRDYRELLKHAKQYFFLFFSEDNSLDIWLSPLIKRVRLLQYQGVEEFGIVSDVRTRDMFGDKKMMSLIYDTINEIFDGAGFFDWGTYWLCWTQTGTDIQNWDYQMKRMVEIYQGKPRKKFLEIGPGIGVCSITLKKLLDLDMTWLNVPDEEPQWNAWRNKSSTDLYQKYGIKIKEAFVETDDFDGVYDIILMSQVIEHFVYNPVPTIKKLMSHLSDNGLMFISVPDVIYNYPKNVDSYKEIPRYEDLPIREATRRKIINSYTHYHEYSYDEALELFEECGLECIDSHTNLPIYHFILRKKR